MRLLSLIPALTAFAVAVHASPHGGKPRTPGPVAKALYFLTDRTPNEVVALPVNQRGFVSAGTFTPTGGDGGVYIVSEGVPVPADSLASQDAVVRSGNVLYVVNAGSNSISSLAIDPAHPTSLSLIEPPTTLIGEFPVTLAVSEELNLLCVSTTGAKNGVECFHLGRNGSLTPDNSGLRSFGLDNQTPPLMASDGPSDMFFSADNTRLYVPVKGNTIDNNGFISVFNVVNRHVAANDTRSTPDGIELLFGGFPVPGYSNRIFASDSGFGAVVLEFDSENHATLVGKTVSNPLVKALCWAEYSPVSKTAWVTSPISNTLFAMDAETSALVAQTNITNSLNGILDFVVPGRYLYGLATGVTPDTAAAIVVVDISLGPARPEVVQSYTIGHGVNNIAHGLAYWG